MHKIQCKRPIWGGQEAGGKSSDAFLVEESFFSNNFNVHCKNCEVVPIASQEERDFALTQTFISGIERKHCFDFRRNIRNRKTGVASQFGGVRAMRRWFGFRRRFLASTGDTVFSAGVLVASVKTL